jgi:hypothetical protein
LIQTFTTVDDLMDTLLSMRVFCLVAELKSFSATADRLGLSPAMASSMSCTWSAGFPHACSTGQAGM